MKKRKGKKGALRTADQRKYTKGRGRVLGAGIRLGGEKLWKDIKRKDNILVLLH